MDAQGFVVLDQCIDRDLVGALVSEVERLWELEGDQAGAEFKQEENTRRLANLVDKSLLFEQVVLQPDSLSLVQHILGTFKLSSLNARSANPHSACRQPLHCDGGYLPDSHGSLVANVIWCLDDFTPENGTLRVVPGTHAAGLLPQDALDDPLAEHADQERISAKSGSLIVMNAHLWHSGVENRTGMPRRALHAYYCRRDQPQQQFQRRVLSRTTQDEVSPQMRHMLALDDTPLEVEVCGANAVSGFLDR